MLSVRGVYDGESILPVEKIDFRSKKDVIITFLDDIINLKVEENKTPKSKNFTINNDYKSIDINTLSNLSKEEKQEFIREICESAASMYKNNPELIIEDTINFIEY